MRVGGEGGLRGRRTCSVEEEEREELRREEK